MIGRLGIRMLRETDPRLLWRFVYHCGWRNGRALRRFRKDVQQGRVVPPFIFLSLTNACNLSCRGCWVSRSEPARHMDPEVLHRILRQARARGTSFFGILGGEPLCYPGCLAALSQHSDCYFLLFTNGTLLTRDVAARLRRLGNVSPLVSIEGGTEVSDERRGGRDVYRRSMEALSLCREQGLVTGVATSLCRSNVNDLASREFAEDLVRRGVHYLWYYIYRPVGPDPAPELALGSEDIVRVRRFLVEVRRQVPLMVVDAYWDHEGHALCPAAAGVCGHIGPDGDLEPCPPIQFAADRVGRDDDAVRQFADSSFLAEFRGMAAAATRGCVLMEQPQQLLSFMEASGARDTTGRGTGRQELSRMHRLPSHDMRDGAIPERQWFYRMAKKRWFFGLGAYG